jgi:hypothetical protein
VSANQHCKRRVTGPQARCEDVLATARQLEHSVMSDIESLLKAFLARGGGVDDVDSVSGMSLLHVFFPKQKKKQNGGKKEEEKAKLKINQA